MPHDPALLAAFNADADQRMVWATHKVDRTRFVYCEDGVVDDDFKAFTKAELACVVPACEVPLTAAARRTRRQGFVHRGPVDSSLHAPESILHQQGKAAIVTWVRTAYPTVRIDEEVVLFGGQRRPDVYAISPTGNRIAFEVQYSALDVDVWQARHDWYVEHDIVDVWLFGHTGPQRSPDRLGAGVRLNALQQHVAANGVPLWWIEPLTPAIATPLSRGPSPYVPGGFAWLSPGASDREAELHLEPLTVARLTAYGLRTPVFDIAVRSAEKVHVLTEEALARAAREAERERVAAERAQAARLAEESRLAALRQAPQRIVFARSPHRARALEQTIASEEQMRANWAASDLRDRIAGALGEVPSWLYMDTGDIPASAVGLAHQHWQSAVFWHAWTVGRSVRWNSQRRKAVVNRRPLFVAALIDGVKAIGLPYSTTLIVPLVQHYAEHLHVEGQLSDRIAGSTFTLLTRRQTASAAPERTLERAPFEPLAALLSSIESSRRRMQELEGE